MLTHGVSTYLAPSPDREDEPLTVRYRGQALPCLASGLTLSVQHETRPSVVPRAASLKASPEPAGFAGCILSLARESDNSVVDRLVLVCKASRLDGITCLAVTPDKPTYLSQSSLLLLFHFQEVVAFIGHILELQCCRYCQRYGRLRTLIIPVCSSWKLGSMSLSQASQSLNMT